MRKKRRSAQSKDDLHDLGSDDLLSRLSDEILVSIMSYLPLKDAVVTSKLSRRWRYLWCQTVRLDFEDNCRLLKMQIVPNCVRTYTEWNKYRFAERNKYINWVNRINRRHTSPTIDQFKICFVLDNNAKGAIGKWIEFAISKNVRILELDLRGNGPGLNNYVFSNKIFDRKCGNSVKIKFLKALILKRVDVNDECLKKILSNCPVLEHLYIYGSHPLVKAKIHGKGLALKSLEIINCDRLESIEICDSNIVSVYCEESLRRHLPVTLTLDYLPKLEKFSIHYCYSWKKLHDMFSQISCCMPYLQVLEMYLSFQQKAIELLPYPELPNLKQLTLKVHLWHDCDLVMLTSLVEACPNLQRLKIQVTWSILVEPEVTNREVRQVAKRSHQHLEKVKIGGYHGWIGDLELALYFIQNCVALKKLVIKPALEITGEEENGGRDNIRQQLEPIIPDGVELRARELLPYPELPKLKQPILKVHIWHDCGLAMLTSLVEAYPNLRRFKIQVLDLSF